MPTLCKTGNCRRAAVYGYCNGRPLYCSEHRLSETYNTKFITQTEANNGLTESKIPQLANNGLESNKCSHPPASTRYKGYCTSCYIHAFPDDPLSLQTLYKSKATVIQKFIDSKFDGFVHCPGFSSIQINGKTLCVIYDGTEPSEQLNSNKGNIGFPSSSTKCIFSPGKYTQLYTQLPKLEQQIADQIEAMVL